MTGLVLAVVTLTNVWGSIAVDPVGATLVSYVPAGGREVIFRSAVQLGTDPRTRMGTDPRTGTGTDPNLGTDPRHVSFNGAAPICFPWVYDDEGRRAELHGCVYNAPWRQIDGKTPDELRFAIEADGYAVECSYRLCASLEVCFSAKNIIYRDTPRRFCFAFHPYFSVSDIEKIKLCGIPVGSVPGCAMGSVPGCTMGSVPNCALGSVPGCEHMKGVVPVQVAAIEDSVWNRRIEVRSPKTKKMMYWNCGKDPRPEYAPGEWRRFLCVEPANNVAADAITLQPGETAEIGLSISLTTCP